MQNNVFDHHDGVIDDQAYGCRQAAERHQVERLPHDLQGDECDRDGHGNHQARDERGSPVAQKHDQND